MVQLGAVVAQVAVVLAAQEAALVEPLMHAPVEYQGPVQHPVLILSMSLHPHLRMG